MLDFCSRFDLVCLIKEARCYKNLGKPCYIDFILTNKPRSFQNLCGNETGLSYFHIMIITATKIAFQKLKNTSYKLQILLTFY